MALIIEKQLLKSSLPIPAEKASGAFFFVKKINLSQSYELFSDTVVAGEILEIKGGGLAEEEKEIVKQIEGKEIEFILWVTTLGNHDLLFISKNSWPLFRDYAILPDLGYMIKVKLKEVKYEGTQIPIFPKRDVIEE